MKLPEPVYDGVKEPIWVSGPPFVWILRDFLNRSVADELIKWCEDGKHFNPSPVGTEGKTGDWGRNSSTCWMTGSHTNPLMRSIQEKASKVAGVALEQMEPLQMVKYIPTQWYHKHHDWFSDSCMFPNNRYATMLVYLNDGFAGGHTDFPELGASVAPKFGSTVFWYNCWQRTPGVTTCFQNSLHQGSPPSSGVKYALNIWIRMYAGPESRCKPKRNADGTSGVGTIHVPYNATLTSEATVENGDVVWMYSVSKQVRMSVM